MERSREWDIDLAGWEADMGATGDFRWPYFQALVLNGLAAATRMMRNEETWFKAQVVRADLSEERKGAVLALAATEAVIRDNLDDATIKQHGGGTKDERLAYVESVVRGAAEVQEQERGIAMLDRKMADLDMVSERALKSWQRQDRTLRFFERLVGALSTFAPESAGGRDALTGQVPPWKVPGGAAGEANVATPHLRTYPVGARDPGLGDRNCDPPDLGDEPPPGFEEEWETPDEPPF